MTGSKKCIEEEIRLTRLKAKNEANNEEYFYQDSALVYTGRLDTLFNVFSYSPVHTLKRSVPKLTLEGCEFEYFLKQSSLINVETFSFVKSEGNYVK